MLDNTRTSDNIVPPVEQGTDSSARLQLEAGDKSSYSTPADSARSTQEMVDAGQVPSLEIDFWGKDESFNSMISTSGLKVVNSPSRGQSDYFAQVDGMDDPGFFYNGEDGAITKSGIDSYIAQNDGTAPRRSTNPAKDEFVNSLKQISENWHNPEMAAYKETEASMTRESFAAGLESLSAVQEQAAADQAQIPTENTPVEVLPTAPENLLVDGPVDVLDDVPVDVSVDKPVDAPAATVALTDAVTELSLVRPGEGPYQVAERVLSSGESTTSHDEVMALVRAMQEQYREEFPEDPNMAGLKVNHQFLSTENVDSLLNSISDPAMKDSIAAKLFTTAESTTADFDTMIATDGLTVFAPPASGVTDFFSEVDGMNYEGTIEDRNDGAITKVDIDNFLSASVANNDMSESSGDPLRDKYVDSLKSISENWDSPEMAAYKDSNGAMTRESFAAGMGMESLPQTQEALAEPIDADQSASSLVLNETAAELSQIRRGEGPYQVAARILSSEGMSASNSEVTALMRAMQAQYRQENPDDATMAGLKTGDRLLTAESAADILEKIADPVLRASIEAKILSTETSRLDV